MDLSLSRAADTIVQRHALLQHKLQLWVTRTSGTAFFEGSYTSPECQEGDEVRPSDIPLEGVIKGLWYRVTVFEPAKSLDKGHPA